MLAAMFLKNLLIQHDLTGLQFLNCVNSSTGRLGYLVKYDKPNAKSWM